MNLEEGPMFTVDPGTWKDVSANIVQLGNKYLRPDVLRDFGFYRVATAGWNDIFFDTYVKRSLSSGTFGQLKYGRKNMSRNMITASRMFPGWRESRQPYGKHQSVTMKELFEEFQKEWEESESGLQGNSLMADDRLAAETIQAYAVGKAFWYGESFSGCVNESPVAGMKKCGDLELPVNIMLLYMRLQNLFHNYIATEGITGIWTYIYSHCSGTVMHLEDASLPSVSLNLGPGSKLWYFTPKSHFKQVQNCYATVGFSANGNGCAHDFLHKRHAPSVETLLKNGIPVYYLWQRPGDIIFVDGCVFHEVINRGYGLAQSTNILVPSWIHVAEAGLHLRTSCYAQVSNGSMLGTKALTSRFSALLRRLRATDANESELAAFDAAIIRLTGKKWAPVNPQHTLYDVIRYGDPVTVADFAAEFSGQFCCNPADVWVDPRVRQLADLTEASVPESTTAMIATEEIRLVPDMDVTTVETGLNEQQYMSVITKDDFLPRRSKRLRNK